MMLKRILIVAFAAGITCASCSKFRNAEPVNPRTVQAPAPPRAIDACALLTVEEVASVQGDTVVNTTSGNPAGGGFATAHCVFSTATPVNSVSLVVVQSSGEAGAWSVREFWRDTFHQQAHAEGADDEEGEKRALRKMCLISETRRSGSEPKAGPRFTC